VLETEIKITKRKLNNVLMY